MSDLTARLRREMDFDASHVHLNNAGVAPMFRPARLAIEGAARLMTERGIFAIDPLLEQLGRDRATLAELVHCPPADLAMAQTCAAAISMVAFGLDLRSGDQIVRWDQEYPSNAYPWHAAAARVGAHVRIVPSNPDWSVDTGRLIDAIGTRTRVVAVSWVQFQTGAMTDLRAVADACRRHNAWLVVDAIQALGVIPFDLATSGVDAVCGGTHKWLCGPVGHGFLALQPGRAAELTPMLQGAFTYGSPNDPVDLQRSPHPDARRFEPGSPTFLGAVGGAASARLLLDAGIDHVLHEALTLADRIADGMTVRGARVLSSRSGALRSPIVTFVPRQPVPQVESALRQHHIAHAYRAGGIRISPHAFNDDSDVDRLFAALDGV